MSEIDHDASAGAGAGLVKLSFALARDEDGYPPFDRESLWARPCAGGYELRNVPFYAQRVSWGDVVAARERGGELVFDRVVRTAGHSTLRIILFDEDRVEELLAGLRRLGCTWEVSNVQTYIAIDVAPEVPLSPVQRFLAEGESAGRWEYEESALRHEASSTGRE